MDHQTRLFWPSIPPHDNDGSRLSCRHLVRHPASFLSPPCIRLRAPILGRGRGRRCILPYSSDTSPDTYPRSGYCTSTRTFHSTHTPSFSSSSDVPFVFSIFVLFVLPNLLPLPTVAAVSRSTLVDAGTG
jgi:hypothetical protein